MQLLYNYLTGNEFRGQVEAIVEGFMAMKNGHYQGTGANGKNLERKRKAIGKSIDQYKRHVWISERNCRRIGW